MAAVLSDFLLVPAHCRPGGLAVLYDHEIRDSVLVTVCVATGKAAKLSLSSI